jgi:hypothetical protein
LTWCTLNVIPIFLAAAWTIGTSFVSTSFVSARRNTFLQAETLHVPSPFVSYFEALIAASALAMLP